MSSLRPAKIVARLYQLLEDALSSPAEPDGPGCSCHQCQKAWNRNQKLTRVPVRAKVGTVSRRMDPN
jgi:hypothetical protein